MKLKLLTLICIALFSATAQAQSGRLSLGVELALPMGDFAEETNLGVGGSLRYEHPLGTSKLSLTGTAGVISFGGEEISVGVPNVAEFKTTITRLMIPVQIGLKYYTMENMESFYIGLETGVHITMITMESETTLLGNTTSTDETDSQTNFGLAPGIGFHMANFDIGLRYQMLFVTANVTSVDPITQLPTTEESSTTYSYLGLRLAYVFGGDSQ